MADPQLTQRPITGAEYRKMAKKPHKYRAQRTEYNERWYHSKAEAEYAMGLDIQKRAGFVKEWKSQIPITLYANNGMPIGKYIADFYIIDRMGRIRFVDVKGYDTPLSKWKRKHAGLQMGIEIEVVKR